LAIALVPAVAQADHVPALAAQALRRVIIADAEVIALAGAVRHDVGRLADRGDPHAGTMPWLASSTHDKHHGGVTPAESAQPARQTARSARIQDGGPPRE